ncbi:MAG TPA: ATP-binding protein [Candidatus Methylacidiphilales bacterium]|nr:ATP-binding protein [Candidatus Methylacidiphilales bacterium]
MDSTGYHLLAWALLAEIIQLLVFWLMIRRHYTSPLRQLGRLSAQLAAGKKPGWSYINGPPVIARISRDLEMLGLRIEELQLRQQEEDLNLNTLLANMVEGVLVVDQRHVIRLINEEMLSLFDLKQSPLNRTVLEALREARVEMIVRETILAGQPRRGEVILENTVQGLPRRHFEISAVPIRAKKGEIGGAVIVFHDITRIKHLEMVRTEFVSNVSHELRTPLAIFRGYLETLLDNPKLPPEELRRLLETLQRHSNRLNSLIEDLLVLARLEARQMEVDSSAIRVEAFFRQLVQDWQTKKDGRAAEIELNIPPSLPPVEVDTLRFEQVILNLLENAVAYSNPPRRIVISAMADGKWMELRVADNGIGIPPADLPHIFERFYRVDKGRSRTSGGTGLGLSIVKQIIQFHHGMVTAESELGKGTAIVIRLPLSQECLTGTQFLPQ